MHSHERLLVYVMPEMEPGLQVTGSAILAGSGRVTGQCVRPGV